VKDRKGEGGSKEKKETHAGNRTLTNLPIWVEEKRTNTQGTQETRKVGMTAGPPGPDRATGQRINQEGSIGIGTRTTRITDSVRNYDDDD